MLPRACIPLLLHRPPAIRGLFALPRTQQCCKNGIIAPPLSAATVGAPLVVPGSARRPPAVLSSKTSQLRAQPAVRAPCRCPPAQGRPRSVSVLCTHPTPAACSMNTPCSAHATAVPPSQARQRGGGHATRVLQWHAGGAGE